MAGRQDLTTTASIDMGESDGGRCDMARYSVLLGSLAAAAGLALACLAQQTPRGQIVQGIRAVRVDYRLGECITFDYTVRNDTSQTINYNFPTTKQYDIWVTHGGEDELFRLSRSKAYVNMATTMSLRPCEQRTFSATWNQKDAEDKQCAPGSYTVHAQLTPSGRGPAVTVGHVRIGVRGAALVPVTIGEAIRNYDGLVGKRVQIAATYRGYSPTADGNTKGGPPVSRSDWAICDSTGCMYVVGSIALDPAKDTGTYVTVVGTLKKTPQGQVYMVLETASIGSGTCPR